MVESVSVLPTSSGEDKVYLSVKLDITDNTNTDIAYPTVTENHPNAVTTFTKSSHSFSNNDAVKLTNFNVTSQNYQVTPYDDKIYKVVNATTNTFQLADILDNKIPSPAFNVSAAAFTSLSAPVGNYVLLSGDGTIDDSSTKWVHLNTYLDNKTTGQYYYFDIRDGKWNFGIYTNYSMAKATTLHKLSMFGMLMIGKMELQAQIHLTIIIGMAVVLLVMFKAVNAQLLL